MMENKEEKRMPRLKLKIPGTVYLTYLLIATLLLTGVTFSGYVTSTTVSDSARVAKFEVGVTLDKSPLTFDNKGAKQTSDLKLTQTKTLTVENKSEVTVNYTLSVNADLPTGITVSFEPESGTLTAGQETTVTMNIISDETLATSGSCTINEIIVTATQVD